jgi:hypothetical protein
VLIEQHDELKSDERRYFAEPSMLQLAPLNNDVVVVEEAMILSALAAAEPRTTDPHGVEKPRYSAGRLRRNRRAWSPTARGSGTHGG